MGEAVNYLWSLFNDPKNPALAAALAALIALVGVIFSATISATIAFTLSRRSSFITAVTVERSKWIDTLRGNLSDLLGTCSAVRMGSAEEARTHLEKLDQLIALIEMQLNPDNLIDDNMIGILRLLHNSIEGNGCQHPNYREIELALVRHAKFVLKEEWEKVTSEALGIETTSKRSWLRAAEKRKAAYEEYCKCPKSLVDTL